MARKVKPPTAPARRPIVPDFELWSEVTRTVTPLSGQTHVVSQKSPAKKQDLDPAPARAKVEPTAPEKTAAASPPPPMRATRPATPPPLGGLDRRTSQRLTRGKAEIDDRIDLHGETGETARIHLISFLTRARSHGARTVLVITGKGTSQFASHTLHGTSHFHTPERQGRLRKLVTQWFEEPEFRTLVAGFQPAHPKHGGGGAFYVRLRRLDRNRPVR